MKHKDFSKRLVQACDSCPDIPAHGEGRQTVIAGKLDISQEATRKYFEGLSRPRPEKMTRLAKILGVDEAWLALGVEPLMPNKKQAQFNRSADVSAFYVFSLFASNGYTCAFNDKVTDDGIDFYAIRSGVQYSISVTTGLELNGEIRVPIKEGYENKVNIVVVPTGKIARDVLHFPATLVKDYGKRKGSIIEVIMERKESAKGVKYLVDKHQVGNIEETGLV